VRGRGKLREAHGSDYSNSRRSFKLASNGFVGYGYVLYKHINYGTIRDLFSTRDRV
jgi:hypothetical protein